MDNHIENKFLKRKCFAYNLFEMQDCKWRLLSSWDEEPSSIPDSETQLLENSLDCKRTRNDLSDISDDMFVVTIAETCHFKFAAFEGIAYIETGKVFLII